MAGSAARRETGQKEKIKEEGRKGERKRGREKERQNE
jgi:hypothetical protein